METNPFAPAFNDLPDALPVFPLYGVLLMPFGQLPLNIFEPRYLKMIDDAMSSNRLIGMIQPKEEGSDKPLHSIGCAGKIVEFSESADGRYLITLNGVCRFRVREELKVSTPYRQIAPHWSDFAGDISRKKCLDVDRKKMLKLLESYFEQEDMSCDFSKFEDTPDGKLMTCLSMVCPFDAAEKQALLEQVCCVQRAKIFMTMLEMAIELGKRPDLNKGRCH